MLYDILKKIRTVLLNDPTIAGHVGTNIAVQEMPYARVAKQITLRKSDGKSDSIVTIVNPTIFITVWIKQKEVTEPYKICREICDKIIDLLNRKGESLNESGLKVNQIVKTDCSLRYDESEEYWVGVLIFDAFTNES
jgi:hypothetical protein